MVIAVMNGVLKFILAIPHLHQHVYIFTHGTYAV